ncbi:hypothetical protein DFR37_105275 [Eoetvoesiella caeni]|uniref:Uncharacterized protein n=1 Tax=Eoetvoesiella caeni TaxID=645616 RepID=A0A366HAZ8_9BURK|nr:hypothetical protein DFR37_105275 [Eoetvoesiella caeni]
MYKCQPIIFNMTPSPCRRKAMHAAWNPVEIVCNMPETKIAYRYTCEHRFHASVMFIRQNCFQYVEPLLPKHPGPHAGTVNFSSAHRS